MKKGSGRACSIILRWWLLIKIMTMIIVIEKTAFIPFNHDFFRVCVLVLV